MQLTDLIKPIEDCTDEELMERLRVIRNNRNIIRPAGAARTKRTVKKKSNVKLNKLDALLSQLSAEEILALLDSGE